MTEPLTVSTEIRTPSGALQPRSGELWLFVYVGALCLAAAGAAALMAFGSDYGVGEPWAVAFLALFAAIAERSSVRLTSTIEISIFLVPTLLAAVLFGPMAAMLVAAASNLADLRSTIDRPMLKWASYTSSRSLTAAAAGITAFAAKDFVGGGVAGFALAAAVGALVAEVLDAIFGVSTAFIRQNGDAVHFLNTIAPVVFVALPLYAPLVALLAVAYNEISPLTLPLFLVPSVAAQQLFALYQQQRRLTTDVQNANQRLESANLSFATALVATLEARDRYTAGHSAAVAIYARDIAARMGLPAEQQRLAHVCGLVHDVGKIGLPVGLLEKPGALTLEERREMERHSEIGERILAKVDDYAEIAAIVRHHHERWDGEGYPDRLATEDIPLISRIIAVADAYNAMTSDRPYRDAMPTRVARHRLAQATTSQFDTSVVAAFEAILAGATDAYRCAQRDDFKLEEENLYGNSRPVAIAV